MWYAPIGFGSVLIGFLILATFAGVFLFAISAVAVAPGVLITTLLFNLLSKQFISNDLWVSSVIFSVLIIFLLRYFYPTKYIKSYILLVIAIGLTIGFYNTYVNHDNVVMSTVNAMYSSNSITTIAPTKESSTILSDNVNLRSSPTQTENIIGTLKSGEKISIKKENADWFFVRVISTGQEGWVYKEYVNRSKSGGDKP